MLFTGRFFTFYYKNWNFFTSDPKACKAIPKSKFIGKKGNTNCHAFSFQPIDSELLEEGCERIYYVLPFLTLHFPYKNYNFQL